MATDQIPPDEIHLWWASLEVDDRRLGYLRTLLDDRELERADRFRVAIKGHRFIAARAVLRLLLGRAIDVDPRQLEFRLGPHGKPSLAGSGPHFNASDSGDHVVIALARDEVGIDIEGVRRVGRHQRLAQRICTPAELEALATVPETDREAAVLRLWTCKEAALKAAGTGLSGGLRNVEFKNFWTGQPEVTRLLGDTDGWSIVFPEVVPEIPCTVVSRCPHPRVVVRRFRPHST